MSQSFADIQQMAPDPARIEDLTHRLSDAATLNQSLGLLALDHLRRIADVHGRTARKNADAGRAVWSKPHTPQELFSAWTDYVRDASQRAILTLDTLRKVGNSAVTQAQTPGEEHPVLLYAYTSVVDGRTLPRPVNYELVQILPEPGVVVDATKRPYLIIDPRAGHGPGIGGFKSDSQVGVALTHGPSGVFHDLPAAT